MLFTYFLVGRNPPHLFCTPQQKALVPPPHLASQGRQRRPEGRPDAGRRQEPIHLHTHQHPEPPQSGGRGQGKQGNRKEGCLCGPCPPGAPLAPRAGGEGLANNSPDHYMPPMPSVPPRPLGGEMEGSMEWNPKRRHIAPICQIHYTYPII